jgi:hypothetical protein
MTQFTYNENYDILQIKIKESSLSNSFFFTSVYEYKTNVYLIKDNRNDELMKVTIMKYNNNKKFLNELCKELKINFSLKQIENLS